MFRDLGFTRYNCGEGTIIYAESNPKSKTAITFEPIGKCYIVVHSQYEQCYPFVIYLDLHRAITQQLNELRWC